MTSFTVGDTHAGVRLDVAVADHLGCSRSRAAARIEAGEVTVDGDVVAKRHRLQAGERVEVHEPPPRTAPPPPALPPIRYEDDHLLVVAKPAGLVVHPGHGHAAGTLVDALEAAGTPLAPAGGEGRPGVVHRLDRDTSGLLLVAKTDRAHAALVGALRARAVTRGYLALVEGQPAQDRGRIDGPIGRDPHDRIRFAVVAGGKPATTRYHTRSVGEVALPGDVATVALLSCRLETGRTHQIRVHLSTLGHPVVGDPAYRGSRRLAEALGLDRPALHAAELAFPHPVTGEVIELAEPLPADLEAALARAGIAPPSTPDR